MTAAREVVLDRDGELSTELPSGVIAMGARTYIPQLGRFLQEDPIAGGSANAYAYTYGDPVNTADPSGAYTATAEGWAVNGSGRVAQEGVQVREAELAAIKAAEEQAAREEAERRAAQAEAFSAYLTAKSESQIGQEIPRRPISANIRTNGRRITRRNVRGRRKRRRSGLRAVRERGSPRVLERMRRRG